MSDQTSLDTVISVVDSIKLDAKYENYIYWTNLTKIEALAILKNYN